MNDVDPRMPRQDVEAITFGLVAYNSWKAAPLSTDEPAMVIESIPLEYAKQLFVGSQLEMAIPPPEVQKLLDFFELINDEKRWYYMGGFLKHPDFQPQQPTFLGTFIDGPGLGDKELTLFLEQFSASVDTLQNKNDASYGNSFYASWGSPSWLSDEMKDQIHSERIPTRIPDKSYIKWKGKELSPLD